MTFIKKIKAIIFQFIPSEGLQPMTDEDYNKFSHNSVMVEVDYEVPLVSATPLTNETIDILNEIKFGKLSYSSLLAQDKW